MNPKDIKIKSVKTEASNWYFTLLCPGFFGLFRIHFRIKSTNKKRSLNVNLCYEDLNAIDAYFESLVEDGMMTSNVTHVTDACLFVERHIQWILETLQRDTKFEVQKLARNLE
jgi:hypothetical protein